MEDLGRNKRITGIGSESGSPEPETVSAPLPRSDRAAWDPAFEGDLPFDESRAARAQATGDPAAHAHVTAEGEQAARGVEARLDEEMSQRPEPVHVPKHAATERAPFVRTPTPHRTQPAVDLMAEDESEGAIDYTHESDFTTRRGSMLSGGGYRRSRNDEKRFKKDLKYGQYLEVPKGRRDLFASKAQMRNRRIALAVIALAAIALVAWIVYALAAH